MILILTGAPQGKLAGPALEMKTAARRSDTYLSQGVLETGFGPEPYDSKVLDASRLAFPGS